MFHRRGWLVDTVNLGWILKIDPKDGWGSMGNTGFCDVYIYPIRRMALLNYSDHI
jgi:hypothetical protein